MMQRLQFGAAAPCQPLHQHHQQQPTPAARQGHACLHAHVSSSSSRRQRSTAALRMRPPRSAAKAPNSSFDAEEDLDSDLAEELSRFRSPDAWDKVAKHLDLVWTVGRGRGKPSSCGCCQGTGEEECFWCHGTGALMVGDTLFRSADGSSHCPVCKGKGYVPCGNCKGTGQRASWLQGPDSCKTT